MFKKLLMSCFALLLLAVCCVGQQKIVTNLQSATICWEGNKDTESLFLLYYRDYLPPESSTEAPDTTWHLLGITKEMQFTFNKDAKRIIALGVRTVLYGDTSELHSSLENTACLSGACDVCSQYGAWYLMWKNEKPYGIRIRN